MYHRKSKHLNTVAFCRNNLGGKCPYSDDMCWWNHGERQEEKVSCYICNTTFETKAHIMIHRKEEHAETVRLCTQFQAGNCRFKTESCWFEHKLENNEQNKEEISENEEQNKPEQVFQKVSQNLEPPLSQPNKQKRKQS